MVNVGGGINGIPSTGFCVRCDSVAQQHWAMRRQEHWLVAALDGTEPENVASLVQRIDAIPDITSEDRRLILRISRPNIRPGEFEINMTHPVLDDIVDQPLDPAEQRRHPFL